MRDPLYASILNTHPSPIILEHFLVISALSHFTLMVTKVEEVNHCEMLPRNGEFECIFSRWRVPGIWDMGSWVSYGAVYALECEMMKAVLSSMLVSLC